MEQCEECEKNILNGVEFHMVYNEFDWDFNERWAGGKARLVVGVPHGGHVPLPLNRFDPKDKAVFCSYTCMMKWLNHFFAEKVEEKQ